MNDYFKIWLLVLFPLFLSSCLSPALFDDPVDSDASITVESNAQNQQPQKREKPLDKVQQSVEPTSQSKSYPVQPSPQTESNPLFFDPVDSNEPITIENKPQIQQPLPQISQEQQSVERTPSSQELFQNKSPQPSIEKGENSKRSQRGNGEEFSSHVPQKQPPIQKTPQTESDNEQPPVFDTSQIEPEPKPPVQHRYNEPSSVENEPEPEPPPVQHSYNEPSLIEDEPEPELPSIEDSPQTDSYEEQSSLEHISQIEPEPEPPPVQYIDDTESYEEQQTLPSPVQYIDDTESYEEQQTLPLLEESTPVNISNYRLNAGDLISIKVFDEDDFSVTTHLNETGTISYPFLGELKLADLTITQVEQLITSGLGKDYLVNPKVTVTVLEYQKIFVNGEVKNPGGYAFVPGLTVNKAISLAGGFTEKSSRDEISIIRSDNAKKKTGIPKRANLKTYMKPGDIIIVKKYQNVFVNGEVNKPGGYMFEPGMTVEKAISLAGGFTEKSSREDISIIRGSGKNKAAKPKLANLKTYVKPGDIINVKEYQNIFVNGEVKKPGGYMFKPGMTVEKAISLAGGFTEKSSREDISIIRGSGKNKAAKPKLANLKTYVKPGDIINVKEYQNIFVNGEVKKPGGYMFKPGMTVEKAISLAGGFTEKSSREDISIIRGSGKNKAAKPKLANLKTYVKPGDIINVKEYQKFFVNGEVKNPGGYAFEPGMTVNKAISLAGGFTEKSSREEISIIRGSDKNKAGIPQPANLKTYVKPGDIISVKEYQKFFVNGEVKNPGGYEFVLGLTVNKAISLAGGFTEKSSREEISIIRGSDKDKAGTPQAANLKTDIKPGDIIIVKEYQKFFVNGEVKKPGGYTFEVGMTVEKAISIAGGFSQFGSAKWSKISVLRGGDETTKPQPANMRTPIHPGDIITIHESAF
jgi:protein involved in polysaccharide export with SLBB domain